MNPKHFLFLLVISAGIAAAQDLQTAGTVQTPAPNPVSTNNSPSVVVDASPHVARRGSNFDLIQSVSARTNHTGRLTYRTNSVYALGNGKNTRDANGNWVPATTGIQLTETGAQAVGTYHKVYFDADIAGSATGAVHLVTGDGKHLRARLAFLAYYEPSSGLSTIISEATNSIGVIDPAEPNAVSYRAALDGGIAATAKYSVTKAGLEQDLVLLSQIPPPSAFSLTNQCRLELWTEMFTPEQPEIASAARPGSPGETFDKRIKLGEMTFAPGFGFPILIGQDKRLPLQTKRSWRVIDGRTWLVEDIEYDLIEPYLRKLGPPRQASLNPTPGSVRYVVSNKRLFPKPRTMAQASAPKKRITFASVPKEPAFVMDWNAVTPTTDLHLLADSTYSIESNTVVWCDGNTVIEGGTVLKFQKDATLAPIDTVECRTSLYRPAIFTSVFDNSVGDSISNSVPVSPWLWTGIATWGGLDAKYLYFHNANVGITAFSDFRASHCQFIHCNHGIWAEWCSFSLRNCLFYDVTNAFYGTGFTGAGQHLTIDQATALTEDYNDFGSSVALTNSLISNVPSNGNATVEEHGCYAAAANEAIFTTAGGGLHYVSEDSPALSTTLEPIDPDLQADLQQMTTQPPLVMADEVLTTSDLVLNMRAMRNKGPLEIGYHYPPVDYAFGAVVVTNSCTVSVSPGTVIATFGTNGVNRGLTLANGATFSSQGSATAPVQIVSYNEVQEDIGTNWNAPSYAMITDDIHEDGSPVPASFDCRFTDFSCPALDTATFACLASPSKLRDCEFQGGFPVFYAATTITNSLFERCQSFITPYTDAAVVQNALFYGGAVFFETDGDSSGTIADSLFDRTDLYFEDSVNAGSHNAYVTNYPRILRNTNHDVILPDTDYRQGPLGRFYYSDTMAASLRDAGSKTADQVSLYHYTTSTNLVVGFEAPETNSVVDIGYHYVSLDASGKATDSDGDGVPDYLEDANGNGSALGDTTSWLTYNSSNFLTTGNGLQVFTPLR